MKNKTSEEAARRTIVTAAFAVLLRLGIRSGIRILTRVI